MRRKDFRASRKVLATTPKGPIVEVSFSGEDDVSRGQKVGAYLDRILDEHQPAAVLFDFIECRQFFDADMGSIIPAFFDKVRDRKRPCALMARGRTARSVQALLELTTLNTTFDVRHFEDRDSAVAYLLDSVSS